MDPVLFLTDRDLTVNDMLDMGDYDTGSQAVGDTSEYSQVGSVSARHARGEVSAAGVTLPSRHDLSESSVIETSSMHENDDEMKSQVSV